MYRTAGVVILTLMLALYSARAQEGHVHYVRADELRGKLVIRYSYSW